MGIDVVDVTRGDAGATDRRAHAAQRAIAVRRRRGDVIGVARQPVTNQFRIDLGPARLCMFERFQHHDAGSFAHHEAVAIFVIRP